MPTATEQLDLAAGVGQRQATWRFDLVDGASGRPLGEIHPDELAPPQLSHDTTRNIPRTLTGINLSIAETIDVNPLTMRVRPVMLVGGAEYPHGTYIFSDEVKARTTAGRTGQLGAVDLMFVVAQLTENTTSFGVGTNVGAAISTVLGAVDGIDGFVVESTAIALGSPIAWPAGTDRGRILTDLATLGGYLNAYMGNDSQIHVRQSFDPAALPADFALDVDGRIMQNTISETTDILDAPNRFIVVDNSNTASPVVGVYDVPVSAPQSAANRGFVIAATFDIQGPGLPANAEQAAMTIGRRQTLTQRTTLATTPDPRFDAYDIVAYDGHNWLEIGWTLTMRDGSAMNHTLQRTYNVGEVIAAASA